MQIYSMDFLQQVIAVQFGGQYVLVTIASTSTVDGVTPPPCQQVTLKLAKGQKLVDKQEKCTKSINPPVVLNRWFIWSNNIFPFPDKDNFNFPGNPTPSYGGQLAQLIDPAFGGFRPPSAFGVVGGPDFTDGTFSSAAHADTYAASWNAAFSGAGGGPVYFGQPSNFFGADGTVIMAAFAPATVELVTLSPDKGSAKTSFSGKYLISVPSALSSIGVTVGNGPGSTTFEIFGYHGATPKTVDKVPATSDTSAFSGPISGTAPFTATSVTTSAAGKTTNTVTASG